MIEQKKNGIIVIVLLSTIFGLAAGIVGSLTIRSYFGTSAAFWGELNFINGNLDRPNLVISGAKKVIVAQDEKVNETISQVSSSLVGIYRRKATSTQKDGINLDSFYGDDDKLGTGLIITSDGWVVSDALDQSEFTKKNKKLDIKKYVVIRNNKIIYKIDKIEVDQATGFIFLHINARDLSVINIANQNNLSVGETVFSLNSAGEAGLSTISSIHNLDDYLSMSSDFYFDKISLVNKINNNFNSSFIFDISGQAVLFIDKKGNLIPARVFSIAIESLFQNGVVSRPSLGLTYADISHLIYSNSEEKNQPDKGALVLGGQIKSKLNSENKIKKGDLIKSIDGITLDKDNNLTKIIMTYSPGDDVHIGLLRGTKEIKLLVKLNELK